jgi:hypothetical protein
MIKNYLPYLKTEHRKVKLILCVWVSALFLIWSHRLQAQQSYTFTPAGATGSLGPTQTQVNSAYLSTNLSGAVSVASGIQSWTVPVTGGYRIEARGAQGGGPFGGMGAVMTGDFTLTAGQVIKVLVGQMGESYGSDRNIGGGGGSFVVVGSNTILVIAGGGGAARAAYSEPEGTTSATGQDGAFTGTTIQGSGGTNGNGGGGASCRGGGGGGWLTNGAIGGCGSPAGNGGVAYLGGGFGGAVLDPSGGASGGFGGGGSAEGTNTAWTYAGGGGGYSGGGGASEGNTTARAGGGGSLNNGTNQANTNGANTGDGRVIITELCNITLSVTGLNVSGALCAGNSVTLTTNAVSNYLWSNGATTSSIVVSPLSTTIYSLSATSPSNCTAVSLRTITVNNAIPSLTVVNTASTSAGICPNSTVNLLASGALTYTWAGGSQPVSNGVTFSPTLAATYTVSGANGCGTSTAVTSVSVHPLPVITPVASSNSLCSGSQLTLTSQGNATTYTWTGGSVPITNGVGFVPPTSTIYTLTGTSVLSCTASATIPVTVYVTPTLAPTASPMIVCIGGSSTLSAVGALSYTWTSATQTVHTSTMIVTPGSSGITTYTVVKANSNCSDTKTISVITNSLPTVAAIVMPGTVCALSPATLAAGGAQTYTWTAPGTPNFTFTGASNIISTPVPATYTVAASDGTCINTSTVHLATNPNPTISASASASSICQGESVSLNATGANNYTWTTGTNTLYTQSITDSPISATAYQVVGDNSFGCTAQASQIVFVSGSPTLSAGPDKNLICNDTPVTFTVSGANSYTWEANSSQYTGSTVVLNPVSLVSGPVIYTVVGTNTIGCKGTRTVQINVFIPVLSISGGTNACKGGTLSLTASGANSGSYNWNTGSGSSIQGAVLTTSLMTPSVFTISASSTSLSITCPVSQTLETGLYPDPVILASAQRTTICVGESVDLYAQGGDSYLWNNGSSSSTITVSPQIQTNYTVTGKDANGCENTATVQVRVSACVGIAEASLAAGQLLVYPNPNNGEFTIQGISSEMRLSLISELGQLIQYIELSPANNYQVSVRDLARGIYFISGQAEQTFIHQKVIVTK